MLTSFNCIQIFKDLLTFYAIIFEGRDSVAHSCDHRRS